MLKHVHVFLVAAIVSSWPVSARAKGDEKDPNFLAGKAALEDRLYDLAEQKFDAFIAGAFYKDKKALGALYYAQALHGQGRYAEMLKWLDAHAEWTDKSALAGDIAFWRARALYDLGRFEDGLALLQDYESRYPGGAYRTQVLRLRTRCLIDLKRFDQALAVIGTFDRDFAGDADAPANLLDMAAVLTEQDRHDEAEAAMRRIVDQYAGSEAAQHARLWLGHLQIDRSQWPDAQQMLQQLAERADAQPDLRAAAWYALARVEDAMTNVAASVDAYSNGVAVARDAVLKNEGRIGEARMLVRVQRSDEAVKLLDEAIKADPAQPGVGDMQLELATALLGNKQVERALDAFQKYLDAISNKEGEASALMGKGWCLWELGRYAEAAKTFEKACLAQTDASAREIALTKEADSYFANAQYALAEERYNRLGAEYPASPQRPQVMYQEGECLARLSTWDKAEAAFRDITSRFAGSDVADRAMMRIASLYESRGQWEDAARVYEEFMAQRKGSAFFPSAWLGRASARYRLGRFHESQDDCEGILGQYAGTDEAEQAYFLRASCFYLLGDVRKAVSIAGDFLKDFPDSKLAPDVVFWLGQHDYNSGAYADAEKRLVDLVARYPQSTLADDALYWAGRAAAEQKEYRRANAHFNDLCKTYSNSTRIAEARFGQGDALTELGEFAGAILAFEEVIRKYPNTELAVRALGRKGDCQFTLGSSNPQRYQEALNSYRLAHEQPEATPDTKLQSEYKIGRCYEKLGKTSDAFDHYMNVVYGWLTDRDQGRTPEELWFVRAAFGAASLKEAEGAWDQAVRIYERVVDAGIPAGRDAEKRIEKIKAEHGLA